MIVILLLPRIVIEFVSVERSGSSFISYLIRNSTNDLLQPRYFPRRNAAVRI